jgi:hypothetical protein
VAREFLYFDRVPKNLDLTMLFSHIRIFVLVDFQLAK